MYRRRFAGKGSLRRRADRLFIATCADALAPFDIDARANGKTKFGYRYVDRHRT